MPGVVPVAIVLTALIAVAQAPWALTRRATVDRARSLVEPVLVDVAAPAVARVPLPVVLELLAAAVRSGAALPRALDVVGSAIAGDDGAALRDAGTALVLGAGWDEAWAGSPGRLDVVATALRPTWEQGASPVEAVRAATGQLRQEVRARAHRAAGRLGVHLVLPLGACFLPAFVFVGLVPVLVALGTEIIAR